MGRSRYPHVNNMANADARAIRLIGGLDEDLVINPCTCLDCGKKFHRGDEGDNEDYCLRCEARSNAEARASEDDEGDYYDHEDDGDY